MLERIITQPDPYEPYLLSQGIRFGDLLFISGQAGAGDDGCIVDGGFLAQGEQAFANLRRALEAGGSSLRDVIKDQNISRYTLIQLSSKLDGGPQGGILNTPFVARFARPTEMTMNMWLETVVEDDGTEVLQLQYEQIIFFEFMFGSNGQTTRWPHIQVNTLRKKA